GPRRFSSLEDIFARIRSKQKRPSRVVGSAEVSHAIAIALGQLPEDRRRVIELRFVEGLTHAEIAAKLNRSEAAVNSLLFNSLRQLRKLVGSADQYLSSVSHTPH